jgi:hypothetical protein
MLVDEIVWYNLKPSYLLVVIHRARTGVTQLQTSKIKFGERRAYDAQFQDTNLVLLMKDEIVFIDVEQLVYTDGEGIVELGSIDVGRERIDIGEDMDGVRLACSKEIVSVVSGSRIWVVDRGDDDEY